MCRASGVAAVIDRSAVPVVDGALEALHDGFVSGGTRRNLEWVRPHLRTAAGVTEDDLLFLADAQTSGVCSSSASCPVIRSSAHRGRWRNRGALTHRSQSVPATRTSQPR
jgi:hypothetical protein